MARVVRAVPPVDLVSPDVSPAPAIAFPRAPPTLVSQFSQLLSRVENEQNQNTELLSQTNDLLESLTNVLTALELVCFDFAICDYIFNVGDPAKLSLLFDTCFLRRGPASSFDLQDIDSVGVHYRWLIDQILAHQTSTIRARTGAPHFESLNAALTQQLESFLRSAERPPRLKCPRIERRVHFGDIAPDQSSLEFTKFICLRVLHSIPISSPLKQLIGRIAYRLTSVHQIQERITLLRDSAECESPTPDYEAIERSPFI
jgi:hypothetical protein